MNTYEVAPGIQWVGAVDWTVRDFHGYRTDNGTSYNSYLIVDEKPAVIDTVKAPFSLEWLGRVDEAVGLGSVAFVVCNHAEPDHSGALPAAMSAMPQAELVCNAKCRETLSAYYDTRTWKFRIVSDGERLAIGRRSLMFIDTPMVHWPESMFTYVPEEGVLFSMDAFGQHMASSRRFDDEISLDLLMREARTYYANIVMLYSKPISKALEKAGRLAIQIIAPSHGTIWRRHVPEILKAYSGWTAFVPRARALVIYDTMWGSTQMMARSIMDGASAGNVETRLFNVRTTDATHIVSEILDAAAIAFGSPTLNMGMMPQMAALLSYLKGLRPERKAAFAFGSYGWGRGGAAEIEEQLKAMKFEIIREPIQSRYAPGPDILAECRDAGRLLAGKASEMAACSVAK